MQKKLPFWDLHLWQLKKELETLAAQQAFCPFQLCKLLADLKD